MTPTPTPPPFPAALARHDQEIERVKRVHGVQRSHEPDRRRTRHEDFIKGALWYATQLRGKAECNEHGTMAASGLALVGSPAGRKESMSLSSSLLEQLSPAGRRDHDHIVRMLAVSPPLLARR